MPAVQRLHADLVVIGLGAMGAATAWRAARRGLAVVGLDARRPPHTLGSTHGHSRIIREAYFEHPQYVPLVQRAYALWAELERTARTRVFQATGGVMIGTPDSPVVAGTLRAAAAHRLTVQTWTAAEIRARVPALAPAHDMMGVFEPRAGVLAPEAAVSAMLASATAAGATVLTDEPVLEWTPRGGRVDIRSSAREVSARHAVLAVGPWLPALTRDLPLALTVERQVQHWYATAGDARFAPGAFPVCLIQTPEGRMLYGLPDQGHGLKLAEHHGGAVTAVDQVARDVADEERSGFHEFASQWVERLPGPPSASAVCLYTNTPDGDFLLDRHPSSPSVYICSPCSGHGFKFAPAIGEAIVSELVGEPSPFDLSPFRLARLLG
jgi:sarcosine oxidase